tara:strand:+ start:982 stop:1203 length:222 start_codon:yes stop_codon:yes gene_type:complete
MEKRTTVLLAYVLAAAAALAVFFFLRTQILFPYHTFAEEQCIEGVSCSGSAWTFCGCRKATAAPGQWYGFFAP